MPKNLKESLMHSKYMVTDKVAYIGTSNWSGDYFTSNTGVGFVIEDSEQDKKENSKNIRRQLTSIFERDWNSRYAVPLTENCGDTAPVNPF